jgi:hypothetical protein
MMVQVDSLKESGLTLFDYGLGVLPFVRLYCDRKLFVAFYFRDRWVVYCRALCSLSSFDGSIFARIASTLERSVLL